MIALLAASLIAILTTVGIVASLLFESVRFFRMVPITDFLFGTHWSPQVIDSSDPGATLGAVPLFWGTSFIGAVMAMAARTEETRAGQGAGRRLRSRWSPYHAKKDQNAWD